MTAALPRIALLTTGGTIAMKTGPDGLGIPSLSAKDLLTAIPEINAVARVDARDVLSKRPSSTFTLDDLGVILQAARDALKDADGIVITHGTDTLEDTAFALSLLLDSDKPVVLTGAMRRGDLPGADGPANLIAACRVAGSPAARGSGVLVVMNDEIHAALYIRKAHSFAPNAFASVPGPLGWVAEDRVRFFLQPAAFPPQLKLGTRRPLIPLLETGFNHEAGLLSLFDNKDVSGLVVNITGGGNTTLAAAEALAGLGARIPVVFATRAGAGETLRSTYGFDGAAPGLIKRDLTPAGWLSGRQARTALMLLLSNGADIAAVRDWFAHVNV